MAEDTEETKIFIKRLHELDHSKSTYEKFRDFCELAYCAYAKLTANTPERADALEARYMQIVGTYQDKDTVRAYPELVSMVWHGVNGGQDFLGNVAGQMEILDPHQGQFFTPQSVSRMTAEMLLHDVGQLIEKQGFITVQEPAAGAGGMVLAAADVLAAKGYNPHIDMLVHAIDVNSLCYHMCFLQLAFRGVAAFVERANSLSLERFEAAWTPATLLFYQRHGRLFPEDKAQERDEQEGRQPPEIPPELPKQLSLF